MAEAEPLRIALVGCGRVAQTYLQALPGNGPPSLEALVEPREGPGEAAAEQNRCPLFRSHDDPGILDLVDAALICSPPNTHHEIATHFLEAGKHVFCEKPLTLSSDQAETLVGLAGERGLVLMMASKFRYVDDILKAKSLIESGILGDIVLYENSFASKVSMAGRWNSDPRISGGGVLIDNGSHSVDIARYLLGPIREVQAQKGISQQGLEVEDTARLQFRTETGILGCIDLSWSLNKESPFYIQVYGREGTLLIGWEGSRFRQDGNSRWVRFGRGYDKLQAFRGQLEDFALSIRKGSPPLIKPGDALASVRVIEAAYESAGREHWLRV